MAPDVRSHQPSLHTWPKENRSLTPSRRPSHTQLKPFAIAFASGRVMGQRTIFTFCQPNAPWIPQPHKKKDPASRRLSTFQVHQVSLHPQPWRNPPFPHIDASFSAMVFCLTNRAAPIDVSRNCLFLRASPPFGLIGMAWENPASIFPT